MKLYFTDGSFSIDYLEVGLAKIDGDIFIFDNSKQEGRKVDFRLEANFAKSSGRIFIDINSLHEDTVDAHYIITCFLDEARKKKTLALKHLKSDDNFFVAEKFALDESIPDNIADHKTILSFVKGVEQRQRIKFKMPSIISEDEIDTLNKLVAMIKNGSIKGKYSDLQTSVDGQESLWSLIKYDDENNNGYTLTLEESEPSIKLFGQTVQIKSRSLIFNGLKLINKPRLKMLCTDMEDGEIVKVKYEPVSDALNSVEEKWELY